HLAIQRQLLELKLEWLRAQEKDLEGMLASTVVVAPFAGVVTSVTEAVPGELVAQNAVAATVADDSGRHVVTRNDDGRLRLLARGQRVEITHGTRQGVAAVTGVIESAPLVAEDLQSAGEVVRIDVTQALDGTAFRLGDPVTVLVEIARAENVLRVPAGALGRRGDRYYVVVQEGGMAREVPIEVGISDGTYYEVRSGLSEGQVVQLLQ
ncbi:MAG: HlyD family efflux transporter periplasmic adaptor subunit, partial [Firmicutes bacterium]|nr:HlyD family efflux transporter periplasmic adaptor subunit [Bacillota bacterium]